jgi:hypothetical protein
MKFILQPVKCSVLLSTNSSEHKNEAPLHRTNVHECMKSRKEYIKICYQNLKNVGPYFTESIIVTEETVCSYENCTLKMLSPKQIEGDAKITSRAV